MDSDLEAIEINSTRNPRVKEWVRLQKGNYRNKSNFFPVEGYRECLRGIQSTYTLNELILCSEILGSDSEENLLKALKKDTKVYHVSKAVYSKLAYRGDSEGSMGIFRKSDHPLPQLDPDDPDDHYFIILENIEKPGNLGAILRTADAVGADGIILIGEGTDQYNPNVIRASLGTVFSVPVYQADNETTLAWCKQNNIPLFCAALPAYEELYSLDPGKRKACVFGAEDKGVSRFWLDNEARKFTIPMFGIADSLNLSVSVAVVSYEFLRKKKKASIHLNRK